MATFGDVLKEIQDKNYERQREGVSDPVRRKYLEALHRLTGRNVVVYYSAFLQRQGPEHFFSTQINDEDKHGFMATFAGMDFDRGLDLILHTPGGDVAATESIIDYLRSKFGREIRTIIPQICMSGGTIISLAGRQIIMGSHSNLGPIDPQIGGRPAIAILAEFEKAREDIINNPNNALLWQPILQQYAPTLLSAAQQSIQWTREIGRKTLVEGMVRDQPDAENKADEIVGFLLSHDLHKAHGRHLHRQELRAHGLEIVDLEDDDQLQDAILSVHHACMLTVGNYNVNKLIENHNGITHAKVVGMQLQMPIPIQIPAGPPQAPTPIQIPVPAPAPVPVPAPQPQLNLWQRLQTALKTITQRIRRSVNRTPTAT
jgi:Serine dehydrogenase proteinase